MSQRTNKVALVFDPEYGDRLVPLAATGHVWVIDTPANREVASEYWARHTGQNVESGITTFKSSETEDPLECCLSILGTIDLHNGEYSSNPPYSVLEVIGVPLKRKCKSALEKLGFETFETTIVGFRATR